MSVGSGTPYNAHLGNGVTTVFAYGFTLLDAGDLVVTVNGVETSAFTVAGIGQPNGGTITFTAAPANGVMVLLQRVIELVRAAEYQDNGDLLAPTLNTDFDRLWMAVQGVNALMAGVLRVPFPETIAQLPSALARANKLLGFSSAGVPVVTVPADGSAAALALALASRATASEGAGAIGVDTEQSSYADRSVGKRIHRDYVYVSDMGGTDPTGTVDNTAQLLAAIATGKLVRLDGFYRHSTSLTTMRAGFIGDGPRRSGLISNACDTFVLPSGVLTDRRRMRLEDFAVDSVANNGTPYWVFRAPGVASGAVPVYNISLYAGGLCIGSTGKMGGGFNLKDFFGAVLEDIVGTDLSYGVRLAGSVVQTEIRNLKSNNDSAGTDLARYGLSTEAATYSSGVMVPENLDVRGLKWIRCEQGIKHAAGLFVRFAGLDTEADLYGAFLNAECALESSIIAPGTSSTAWTGVFVGVSPATPDAGIWLEDLDINCLRAPGTPGSSYGVDIGNGSNPVYFADLENIRIRGVNGALQEGVRARDVRSLRLARAAIRSTAVVGDDINVSGRRITLEDNVITDASGATSGSIVVSDGGNASAAGRINNNQSTTLIFAPTNRGNWQIHGNDAVKRWNSGATSVADGGTIAHGLSSTPTRINLTTTTSGEFASVTATGASTFTVALKKHDNTAGTPGTVYWEAEY